MDFANSPLLLLSSSSQALVVFVAELVLRPEAPVLSSSAPRQLSWDLTSPPRNPPESKLLTATGSSQTWLVVVIEFVFQPAEPDSSSATLVVISVMAELCEEKVDLSNGGFPFICTACP
ncbi:hypothetical protein Bca4012_066018 [Brassica carinata]|uniref:Uncharacterized protein n=1 Tax=Brassica carinata TaxID=52824 RepID=A0A8X8AYH1_BRACI|nr:hypothetical protein Bca52824_018340 [Brassica carinata]